MFLLLVTLISLVLAVIMGVIAWHVSQEEQRRSEARVAALTAEIGGFVPTVQNDPAPLETDLPIRETTIASEMFAAASTAHTNTRLAAVVAIGFIVFGSAAAVAVVLGRSGSHGVTESGVNEPSGESVPSQAIPPNPRVMVPLELIALGHERDRDRLTVRGVIRNPAVGGEADHVTAVVFLFNREGGFVGSGRAALESAALVPGGESAFVITVAGVGDVAKYRVSFRMDDRLVPHVDRRDHMQPKS